MPPCADDNLPHSRADLAGCVERVLRPATRAKPAILLVHCGGHRVIVKDFSQNGWMLRNLYGRYVVRHECRIYRQLDGVEGVPAFHGRIDTFAFAVDLVEGTTLKRLGSEGVSAESFERLARVIGALHARGVVHLDAHQKTNVLVDGEGRPYLMDFATAVYLGRGWLARKVLVPLLARADWRGFLKLKARYCPEALPSSAGSAATGPSGARRSSKPRAEIRGARGQGETAEGCPSAPAAPAATPTARWPTPLPPGPPRSPAR